MMRNIKVLILSCLMSVFTLNISAQEKYDWSSVMNAIIQVESKGDPKAHNKNGDCVGILQITKILVKEVNDILKRKGDKKRYTNQDRWDVEKSKEMFIILQEHFNKEHNVEKAIRCWNGGFYGDYRKKPKTKKYYEKVMRYYNKKGS